ncbi:MAG: lysophospholipid acyltransferase family protein, partial [Candidatus Omnitrophota bacterium]
LFSCLIWSGIFLATFVLFVRALFFTVIFFFSDKERRKVHALGQGWADLLIDLNPFWKLKTVGLENLDQRKTYVVVANHQSAADPIVIHKIRMQFKWIAKKSLFKIPLLGWYGRLSKHICLERGDFGSVKKSYREAAYWLRRGISVVFFPEGTRSESGQMLDFKNGAFKLAIQLKIPVLPICIQGTLDAIPKGDWVFRKTAFATVTILPAIETAHLEMSAYADLKDRVWADMKRAMGDVDRQTSIRSQTPAQVD